MTLETLRADMIKAMKEKDKFLKDVVSSLIAAIKKVAIDEGVREDIKEELVDRVILKELKTAKEQIDTCPDERAELKEEYQKRYDIISTYAPKQLSEDEIIKIITEKFRAEIETKNKGIIMKAVMGELKGKADGKLINQVVAKLTQ
ncbi:MAG: GatB/YqeY domain-containing protein [Clostridia bacterium]|nr:GatB/YqeY domain-containing protein [Clostridia bacterium]